MKNLNVRLADSLHARVKQAAEADDRSLNGQITWLLKLGLDMRDTTPTAVLGAVLKAREEKS
jgi:hypothetical protein